MSKKPHIVIALRLLALAAIGVAGSAGLAGADVITVPVDQPTISAAIAAAVDTDEIVVEAGTYEEVIDFDGKAITIRSEDGPEATIIDGNGLGNSVVSFLNMEQDDSVLEGFTITRGTGNTTLTAVDVGGGVVCSQASPTITDCIFIANGADLGGAMYNASASSPTITDCFFLDNTAADDGGAIYNSLLSSPMLISCFAEGNMATNDGGFLYNFNGSTARVFACTITGNTAGGEGGAAFSSNSAPVLANSILWANVGTTANEIAKFGAVNAAVDHCNIDGSGGSGAWTLGAVATDGGGNLDEYPSFIDASAGNYQLCRFSPCIDAGRNSALPVGTTTDLNGDARFVDDTGVDDTGIGVPPLADIGAYEVQFSSLPMLINLTPGQSIQENLECAVVGDEIVLGPGTYNEVIDLRGLAVTIRSSLGAAVTTIDGTGFGDTVVKCINGEGPDTIIEGLTITGGSGETDSFGVPVGGGMACVNSNPTVRDCIFLSNTAEFGGGIYASGSNPIIEGCDFVENEADVGGGIRANISTATITECTFTDNIAFDRGGGIANTNGSPIVTDNTFTSNEAVLGAGISNDTNSTPKIARNVFTANESSNGGGVATEASDAEITDCVFTGNTADLRGGAMYLSSESTPEITNCVFSGNSALGLGGAIENRESDPTVVNCAFQGNSATFGGAMNNENLGMPLIYNCIMWGNVATATPQIRNQGDAVATIINSDVEGSGGSAGWDTDLGVNGGGNIDQDPLFVNPAAHNLRLQAGSPCIDAGNNILVPPSVVSDLDENDRFHDDPATVDSGAPAASAPYVDMGPYEFGAGPAPVTCPGDTNGDNLNNIDDIVNAVICFGQNGVPNCAGPGTTGDIDDGSGTGTPDGLNNIDDIVFAVLRFGQSCP